MMSNCLEDSSHTHFVVQFELAWETSSVHDAAEYISVIVTPCHTCTAGTVLPHATHAQQEQELCTVDPRLSEQQWPEDSKNHADK